MTTWSKTHDDLQRVLNQLDDLNAGVVAFRVDSLPEPIAAQWLESESKRLEKLIRLMGEQMRPTPSVDMSTTRPQRSPGNPQVVDLPIHRRCTAHSR